MDHGRLHEAESLGPKQLGSIVVHGPGLVCRGMAELKPRRIQPAVLLPAVARQVAESGAQLAMTAPGLQVSAMAVTSPAEATRLRLILRHTGQIAIRHPSVDAVIALLMAAAVGDGLFVLALIADDEPPGDEWLQSAARGLIGQDSGLEARCAKQISESAPTTRDGDDELQRRIVIEERMGKAMVLGLATASARLASKRLGSGGARTSGPPQAAPSGWGVGGLAVSRPNGDGRGRPVRFVAETFQLPLVMADIDLPTRLAALAVGWWRGAGELSGINLCQVVLAVPYLALAGAAAEAMVHALADVGLKQVRFELPDQVFGWGPSLTLVEAVANGELPCLLVFLGAAGEVTLVGLW